MDNFSREYNITVAGHSYVKWLRQFILNDTVDVMGRINTSFGIYKENVTIDFHARPGANMFDLKRDTHLMIRKKIDILIMIIGGNDLSSGNIQPCELAVQVFRYAEYLLSKDVKFIVAMQVIERNIRGFKENADSYNARLKALMKNHPQMRFWDLRRISPSDLRGDGVHLNNRGNYFLYNAVKASIRHALEHISEGSACIHDIETVKLRGGKKSKKR